MDFDCVVVYSVYLLCVLPQSLVFFLFNVAKEKNSMNGDEEYFGRRRLSLSQL